MSTVNLLGNHELCTPEGCVALNVLTRRDCPAKAKRFMPGIVKGEDGEPVEVMVEMP